MSPTPGSRARITCARITVNTTTLPIGPIRFQTKPSAEPRGSHLKLARDARRHESAVPPQRLQHSYGDMTTRPPRLPRSPSARKALPESASTIMPINCFERRLRRPAQLLPRLRRVAAQHVDLRRPQQLGVRRRRDARSPSPTCPKAMRHMSRTVVLMPVAIT